MNDRNPPKRATAHSEEHLELDKHLKQRAGSSSSPAASDSSRGPAPPARGFTTWHVTFGTYGTRLHGDARPTVEKQRNHFGEGFVQQDPERQRLERERMSFETVNLTLEQRRFVEEQLPVLCERGGWKYRTAAAAPDHVHVLCDVPLEVHGEKVRRLLKRWLGQALSERWPLPKGATWWAEEGSNKAVQDYDYRVRATQYVFKQRTSK